MAKRLKSKPTSSPKIEKIIIHSSDSLRAGPRPERGRMRSGSIEQQLDMIEKGPMRGDEILHQHGIPFNDDPRPPLDEYFLQRNYRVDMSEDRREGDEESGDEHSSGLQGSDQAELQTDIADPADADSGAPGEMTEKLAKLDPTMKGYRRRAG